MTLNWKKIIKYGVIFLLVIIAIKTMFGGDKIKTVSVKNIELENRTVVKTVSTSGEVTSEQEASLSFGVTGDIAELYVEKGDIVKKGDLLAIQDNYGTLQTVQANKDARDIAIRDRELYIENYSTNLQAVGGKDEYAISLRRQDELVSKAEATYQASRSGYLKTYIYAPFDGSVIDIYVDESESVTAGVPVIKLANTDKMTFEITVDQEDFGLLQVGQKVDIELDAYADQVFVGEIQELPNYANGGDSPSFTVDITLLGDADVLSQMDGVAESTDSGEAEVTTRYDGSVPLLGMTGDAHIVVASTSSDVPSLFYDEVFFDEEDNPYVWVMAGELIAKYPIEIGLEGDIYTEIKSEIDKPIIIGLNDDVEVKEGYKAKLTK